MLRPYMTEDEFFAVYEKCSPLSQPIEAFVTAILLILRAREAQLDFAEVSKHISAANLHILFPEEQEKEEAVEFWDDNGPDDFFQPWELKYPSKRLNREKRTRQFNRLGHHRYQRNENAERKGRKMVEDWETWWYEGEKGYHREHLDTRLLLTEFEEAWGPDDHDDWDDTLPLSWAYKRCRKAPRLPDGILFSENPHQIFISLEKVEPQEKGLPLTFKDRELMKADKHTRSRGQNRPIGKAS